MSLTSQLDIWLPNAPELLGGHMPLNVLAPPLAVRNKLITLTYISLRLQGPPLRLNATDEKHIDRLHDL